MVQAIETFKNYPASVRNGILYLFSAWIWHYICLYLYFTPGRISLDQLALGLGTCFLVFQIKNWARIITLYGNIIIVAFYLLCALNYMIKGDSAIVMSAALNVVLFSFASYFLFVRESSRFFRERSPKPTEDDRETQEKAE